MNNANFDDKVLKAYLENGNLGVRPKDSRIAISEHYFGDKINKSEKEWLLSFGFSEDSEIMNLNDLKPKTTFKEAVVKVLKWISHMFTRLLNWIGDFFRKMFTNVKEYESTAKELEDFARKAYELDNDVPQAKLFRVARVELDLSKTKPFSKSSFDRSKYLDIGEGILKSLKFVLDVYQQRIDTLKSGGRVGLINNRESVETHYVEIETLYDEVSRAHEAMEIRVIDRTSEKLFEESEFLRVRDAMLRAEEAMVLSHAYSVALKSYGDFKDKIDRVIKSIKEARDEFSSMANSHKDNIDENVVRELQQTVVKIYNISTKAVSAYDRYMRLINVSAKSLLKYGKPVFAKYNY